MNRRGVHASRRGDRPGAEEARPATAGGIGASTPRSPIASSSAVTPGHVEGHIGRAADDPDLWLVVTRWTGAGPYRRALSSYDVKARATPLLSRAIDEPTAFELVAETGGSPAPG